jgi:hypothetical protein
VEMKKEMMKTPLFQLVINESKFNYKKEVVNKYWKLKVGELPLRNVNFAWYSDTTIHC